LAKETDLSGSAACRSKPVKNGGAGCTVSCVRPSSTAVSGPVRECPHPATWRSNTVSRAARSWPRLIILEVKATSKCEWAQARSWPRPYLTKLLPAVAVRLPADRLIPTGSSYHQLQPASAPLADRNCCARYCHRLCPSPRATTFLTAPPAAPAYPA
jgi:hypothetical protein